MIHSDWNKKNKHKRLCKAIGGVFSEYENTYYGAGKDWWCLSYYPKYPEHTAADMIITHQDGYPYILDGNLYALIPTTYKFNTLEDLISFVKGERNES